MGGVLSLESQPGRGSTFRFTVQFGRVPQSQALAPQPSFAGVRAIVVDDNTTTRNAVCTWLRRSDIECIGAGSADEAIAEVRRADAADRPYHAYIIDAVMPGADGFELAAAIRKIHTAAKPILMLTQSQLNANASRMETAGISCYCVKPLHTRDLHSAIARTLGSQSTPLAPPTERRQPVNPASILLVEDNRTNQKVAVGMLQSMGHAVEIAENGLRALAKAVSSEYDLILMDVQMPAMDGFEATRKIREREGVLGKHTPIVAMTAHALAGDRERCLEAGMDSYISKPLSKRALASVIEKTRTPRLSSSGNDPCRFDRTTNTFERAS
jgi:two-component system, sensor histidine kinase and response regulator